MARLPWRSKWRIQKALTLAIKISSLLLVRSGIFKHFIDMSHPSNKPLTSPAVTVKLTALNKDNLPRVRSFQLQRDNPTMLIGRATKSKSKNFHSSDDNLWIPSPVMSRDHAEVYCASDGSVSLTRHNLLLRSFAENVVDTCNQRQRFLTWHQGQRDQIEEENSCGAQRSRHHRVRGSSQKRGKMV